MELLHTSDLHLVPEGFENTPLEEAFYSVLEEIAGLAVDHKLKYLLIAGDFFDKPNPSFHVVLRTVGVLRRLRESGVRVVVVPGNHDVSRAKTSILNVLAEAGLVNLLDFNEESGWLILHPLAFEDDKLVFYGIPGFRGSSSRELVYLKQGLIKFKDIANYSGYDVIILAHINTKFAGYDPSKYSSRYGLLYMDYEDLLRSLPTGTRYVALGHIHLPVPLDRVFRGNIAYPGAPIGMDVNDLLETHELAKIGVRRRVLRAELASEIPVVKSLELESAPRVYYKRLEAKTPEDVKARIYEALSELEPAKYPVLLVDVVGLDKVSVDLETFRQEVMKRKKVYIRVRQFSPPKDLVELAAFTDLMTPVKELSIDEIELAVIRELASKKKLNIPAEKLHWIINYLGSSHDYSPEKLLHDVLKELGE